LAERIGEMLDDERTLVAMGERSRAWSRPDAADALAEVVLEAGGRT
jgi:UDP-N-acetylglucosamine:LPS N-acetylglucosamine transferase